MKAVANLPDHNDLPCSDGAIVENFLEHPQSEMLKASIRPHLDRLHPDGLYAIGTDSGIYWKLTDPPLQGCKSPDWYYIPGVPQMLHGEIRRSYVLWQEKQIPLLAIEYVSRDGSEEHDDTPETGKFWVYEQGIRIPYYAIFNDREETLEVYHLEKGRYRPMTPNARGRYDIPPMEVALGLWEGTFDRATTTWLRWFDRQGKMLPIPQEEIARAKKAIKEGREKLRDAEKQVTEERQLREAAEKESEALKAKLRALGIDPEA